MRTIRITEGDRNVTVPFILDIGEVEALQSSELVRISRFSLSDEWIVESTGRVGMVRLGADLQVLVEPKIPVQSLIFMMGYAKNPSFWRSDPVWVDQSQNFSMVLADSFVRLFSSATSRGLLNGYSHVTDHAPVVRGRIDVSRIVRENFGRSYPVPVEYDDFGVDVPENQLLLACVLKLLKVPGLSDSTRKALRRARVAMCDVSQRTIVPPWTPNRLNAHYQPVLELAQVILEGRSVDFMSQRGKRASVNGFVFDMWRIFEDFVGVALSEQLKPYGVHLVVQSRMHLDVQSRISIRPDLVFSKGRRTVSIGDVKYTEFQGDVDHQADHYQVLSYCAVTGAREGHLVYVSPTRLLGDQVDVRNMPVRIWRHAIDLSVPPGDLIDQVDEIARHVGASTEKPVQDDESAEWFAAVR